MSNKKDFLDFVLKFLHGSGLGPQSPKYGKIISLGVLLPMTLVVDIFIFYDFFQVKGDILKIAALMESTSSFGQVLVRKFILVVKAKHINDLVALRERFWDYDVFGKQLGNCCRKKLIWAIRFIKFMLTTAAILIVVLALNVIVDDKKKVLLESFTPSKPLLAYLVCTMQMFSLLETAYLLGAVDALFVLLSVEMKIQLTLLRQRIQIIQLQKNCLNELITCVKHHDLLLKFHKILNQVFSEYFLVQYALTVLAACVQLYILMYNSARPEDAIKCVCYLVALFLQVAMFFMPASEIEDEAEKLVVDIYNVKWEENSNGKIRKQLLFMLMRAQQPLSMMGGGMVYINRREYVVVFKLAFSIATVLGGIK